MQTELDKKLNDKIVYGGGRVLFVFLLLFSLIPIRETLASVYGAQIIFEVIFSWLFLLLAGLIVWQSAHKKRMERTTAGVVLMQLGMAALTAFSALAEVSTRR